MGASKQIIHRISYTKKNTKMNNTLTKLRNDLIIAKESENIDLSSEILYKMMSIMCNYLNKKDATITNKMHTITKDKQALIQKVKDESKKEIIAINEFYEEKLARLYSLIKLKTLEQEKIENIINL